MSTEQIADFPKFAASDRLYQPAQVRRSHDYIAVAGTTADEVLKPEYWRRVSKHFSVYDRIDVIEESGAWYAELLVLSASDTGVHIAPLRGIALDGRVGVNDAATRNYTGSSVKYRGPHLKWCVLDKDGKPLHERAATESDAYAWLNAYVKTVQK